MRKFKSGKNRVKWGGDYIYVYNDFNDQYILFSDGEKRGGCLYDLSTIETYLKKGIWEEIFDAPSVLKPEEVRVGQTITVLKWKSGVDRSFQGDKLEVKSIVLPYIYVREKDSVLECEFCLDTREVELMLIHDPKKPSEIETLREKIRALEVEKSYLSKEIRDLENRLNHIRILADQ